MDSHAQPNHSVLDCSPIWYDYCKSSDHDINSCPYHMNDASCANLENMMNGMTLKMIEAMKENMLKWFNQIREFENVHKPNFSLGYLIPEVSLGDDF